MQQTLKAVTRRVEAKKLLSRQRQSEYNCFRNRWNFNTSYKPQDTSVLDGQASLFGSSAEFSRAGLSKCEVRPHYSVNLVTWINVKFTFNFGNLRENSVMSIKKYIRNGGILGHLSEKFGFGSSREINIFFPSPGFCVLILTKKSWWVAILSIKNCSEQWTNKTYSCKDLQNLFLCNG